VLFSTSLFADPHDLASAGLADLVHSPQETAERVKAALRTPAGELSRRRALVWGTTLGNGGQSAVAEMESLLR
jgi:hypothetical protein